MFSTNPFNYYNYYYNKRGSVYIFISTISRRITHAGVGDRPPCGRPALTRRGSYIRVRTSPTTRQNDELDQVGSLAGIEIGESARVEGERQEGQCERKRYRSIKGPQLTRILCSSILQVPSFFCPTNPESIRVGETSGISRGTSRSHPRVRIRL